MKTLSAILAAAALAASLAATPAYAQQSRSNQQSARAEMQAGRNMPIREIERRIIPRMESSDEYIGFEYDETAQAYRLKFIRNGRMIWVDVDAQTARILRISQ
ncbi:hypothetical protein [Aurantiacibacter poecillastricola]|uniref:hypothetical protein n=1 Tax=Aurantiacibacter poecillastricola TaxID=3064385 RepID=UPI00273E0A97|nr:hypothetical protein [Aurantiacibacter sp. 219JJ12-13]MDP5262673.1 hypothetical protein [Aurantiacibacter sp. 219JJ12-13]